MAQITIVLRPSEKEALILLANREYRKTTEQAALIIRSELERRGLLEYNQIPEIQNKAINKEVQNVRTS